jgi:hypothetical protein
LGTGTAVGEGTGAGEEDSMGLVVVEVDVGGGEAEVEVGEGVEVGVGLAGWLVLVRDDEEGGTGVWAGREADEVGAEPGEVGAVSEGGAGPKKGNEKLLILLVGQVVDCCV